MSTISDHIFSLYNQLKENEIQHIDDYVVDEAVSVINSTNPTDTRSLFYILAAINLLNAAIKLERHKSHLFYGFIKSKIGKLADTYLNNPEMFEDVSVYYDNNQKCIYFDVYGVIFSFHQIQESKLIKTVASNNQPIIWAGIRLQRIAQNVFLYAKEHHSIPKTTEDSEKLLQEVYKNSLATTDINPNLSPCPDCNHMISISAQSCPFCGSDLRLSENMLEGIRDGYSVRVSYNGMSSFGRIEDVGKHIIKLVLDEEKWIRLKVSALDSVEIIDTNELSADLFAQQASTFFEHFFETTGIDKEALIITNSTITNTEKIGISVITDSGESVLCVKPGIVGYKKKTCTIGRRVYCGNIGSNGKCNGSIVEMSYGGLIGFFRKAISYNQNITQARKAQIFSILTFLMKETSNNPEAYLEIKNFRKKVKAFLGQLTEESDSFTDIELPSEESGETNEANKVEDVQQQKTILYKTESEQITPQLKIVGKIDLDKVQGKKKTILSTNLPHLSLEKPSIINSNEIKELLDKKLTNLSESKCKALEKELDSLIRNGEKEECLKRSYEIINTSRPTPKYLKSYLDRIVNTEIALDHVSEAIRSLAFLIAVSEQQDGTNANNLGHLYITMARLYLKENNKEEALKAILYAENLRPDNNAIKKLKDSIMSLGTDEDEKKLSGADSMVDSAPQKIADDNISKMLLQDVEQEARRQELLPNSELVPAEQLFGKAQNNRNNQSDTFDDKAFSFLEAAAAYYNNKQMDTVMFKISVANYARFKGHGMFTRFANHLKANSYNLDELQAFRDSACSYYLEALGIFNALGEKNYLQELFLKYLQLAIVISNIEGGKTTADDWENWTLHQLQLDCIKADSLEEKKVLFNTCISVGTAAEGAWNTLYQDQDGLYPFISRFGSQKFREESYSLFNELAESSISLDFQPSAFMHKIFEHRQVGINKLKNNLEDCLKWSFSPFDISTFEIKWNKVVEYKQLMTTTDRKVISSIKDVIDVLKPYASRIRENERTRFLVRSQQILLGTQKTVTETATFYGRTFFSHLISAWLSEIAQLLEERYVNTYPKLEITPDPCYIKINEEGKGVIDFLVTNIGDSTAQSFTVNAYINGKEYTINHIEELSAGDCCVESFVSLDFLNVESIDVYFNLTIRYEGKDLPSTKSEATYEIESGDILTDEIQIPWKISDTPKENIFKGREEKLSTLISHYLSKDRTQTYILYGLTRTGKSSILDYLCERIEGQPLCEDSSKKIKTFKWDFSKISFKNASVADLWMNLLELNIYNKLPENILDVVDKCFLNGKLPETLCQSDLDIMIDALNSCGIIPLVTIDEFSNIRPMLKEGLVDATFISELRDLALKGKACFVYAGTYDIKELPKEQEFGIEGQMTNTRSMHINEIEQVYADELIDACESIVFVEKAKAYIRSLSGCVPYWIQWICLDCGKYAVAHKKRHLGYRDVDHVVRVLTGEEQPSKMDTWEAMDETNFHNNQISPNNIAEHQLISCIAYLVKESTQIERGVSMDEFKRLWDKYNVPADKRLNMTRALKNLEEKRVIRQFTDETREVYRLNVDLFRRWWYMHHRDLALEFSL